MPGPLSLCHRLSSSWNYGPRDFVIGLIPLNSFTTADHAALGSVFEPLVCISSFSFPSPLFLGNLWDVTDRDIDRYTEALLQGWLRAGSGAPLLYYVSQARQAPRLKYLIGAAPVAYGLPVSLR